MIRHRVFLVAAACALGACQPAPSDTEAADRNAAPSPATVPEPMPDLQPDRAAGAVDAVQVADATTPAGNAAFDARRFAGRYASDAESLEVGAEGRYRLATPGRLGTAAAPPTGGTWSVDATGRHVLLDADDKATADRLFALAADGSLRESGGTAVLRRASE
ncbi:MAG TPA: hypothetical protein VLK29_10030 [Luteimonas sp.]|nr:hypothetical protein [Luteimonas sp.]